MRMWMVDPALMCRKHLLGEHVECHMLLGSLKRKKSIAGFIEKGLLTPLQLETRHNRLAREMTRRGYQHKSPLKVTKTLFRYLPEEQVQAKVNARHSLKDLVQRCADCRQRQKKSRAST